MGDRPRNFAQLATTINQYAGNDRSGRDRADAGGSGGSAASSSSSTSSGGNSSHNATSAAAIAAAAAAAAGGNPIWGDISRAFPYQSFPSASAVWQAANQGGADMHRYSGYGYGDGTGDVRGLMESRGEGRRVPSKGETKVTPPLPPGLGGGVGQSFNLQPAVYSYLSQQYAAVFAERQQQQHQFQQQLQQHHQQLQDQQQQQHRHQQQQQQQQQQQHQQHRQRQQQQLQQQSSATASASLLSNASVNGEGMAMLSRVPQLSPQSIKRNSRSIPDSWHDACPTSQDPRENLLQDLRQGTLQDVAQDSGQEYQFANRHNADYVTAPEMPLDSRHSSHSSGVRVPVSSPIGIPVSSNEHIISGHTPSVSQASIEESDIGMLVGAEEGSRLSEARTDSESESDQRIRHRRKQEQPRRQTVIYPNNTAVPTRTQSQNAAESSSDDSQGFDSIALTQSTLLHNEISQDSLPSDISVPDPLDAAGAQSISPAMSHALAHPFLAAHLNSQPTGIQPNLQRNQNDINVDYNNTGSANIRNCTSDYNPQNSSPSMSRKSTPDTSLHSTSQSLLVHNNTPDHDFSTHSAANTNRNLTSDIDTGQSIQTNRNSTPDSSHSTLNTSSLSSDLSTRYANMARIESLDPNVYHSSSLPNAEDHDSVLDPSRHYPLDMNSHNSMESVRDMEHKIGNLQQLQQIRTQMSNSHTEINRVPFTDQKDASVNLTVDSHNFSHHGQLTNPESKINLLQEQKLCSDKLSAGDCSPRSSSIESESSMSSATLPRDLTPDPTTSSTLPPVSVKSISPVPKNRDSNRPIGKGISILSADQLNNSPLLTRLESNTFPKDSSNMLPKSELFPTQTSLLSTTDSSPKSDCDKVLQSSCFVPTSVEESIQCNVPSVRTSEADDDISRSVNKINNNLSETKLKLISFDNSSDENHKPSDEYKTNCDNSNTIPLLDIIPKDLPSNIQPKSVETDLLEQRTSTDREPTQVESVVEETRTPLPNSSSSSVSDSSAPGTPVKKRRLSQSLAENASDISDSNHNLTVNNEDSNCNLKLSSSINSVISDAKNQLTCDSNYETSESSIAINGLNNDSAVVSSDVSDSNNDQSILAVSEHSKSDEFVSEKLNENSMCFNGDPDQLETSNKRYRKRKSECEALPDDLGDDLVLGDLIGDTKRRTRQKRAISYVEDGTDPVLEMNEDAFPPTKKRGRKPKDKTDIDVDAMFRPENPTISNCPPPSPKKVSSPLSSPVLGDSSDLTLPSIVVSNEKDLGNPIEKTPLSPSSRGGRVGGRPKSKGRGRGGLSTLQNVPSCVTQPLHIDTNHLPFEPDLSVPAPPPITSSSVNSDIYDFNDTDSDSACRGKKSKRGRKKGFSPKKTKSPDFVRTNLSPRGREGGLITNKSPRSPKFFTASSRSPDFQDKTKLSEMGGSMHKDSYTTCEFGDKNFSYENDEDTYLKDGENPTSDVKKTNSKGSEVHCKEKPHGGGENFSPRRSSRRTKSSDEIESKATNESLPVAKENDNNTEECNVECAKVSDNNDNNDGQMLPKDEKEKENMQFNTVESNPLPTQEKVIVSPRRRGRPPHNSLHIEKVPQYVVNKHSNLKTPETGENDRGGCLDFESTKMNAVDVLSKPAKVKKSKLGQKKKNRRKKGLCPKSSKQKNLTVNVDPIRSANEVQPEYPQYQSVPESIVDKLNNKALDTILDVTTPSMNTLAQSISGSKQNIQVLSVTEVTNANAASRTSTGRRSSGRGGSVNGDEDQSENTGNQSTSNNKDANEISEENVDTVGEDSKNIDLQQFDGGSESHAGLRRSRRSTRAESCGSASSVTSPKSKTINTDSPVKLKVKETTLSDSFTDCSVSLTTLPLLNASVSLTKLEDHLLNMPSTSIENTVTTSSDNLTSTNILPNDFEKSQEPSVPVVSVLDSKCEAEAETLEDIAKFLEATAPDVTAPYANVILPMSSSFVEKLSPDKSYIDCRPKRAAKRRKMEEGEMNDLLMLLNMDDEESDDEDYIPKNLEGLDSDEADTSNEKDDDSEDSNSLVNNKCTNNLKQLMNKSRDITSSDFTVPSKGGGVSSGAKRNCRDKTKCRNNSSKKGKKGKEKVVKKKTFNDFDSKKRNEDSRKKDYKLERRPPYVRMDYAKCQETVVNAPFSDELEERNGRKAAVPFFSETEVRQQRAKVGYNSTLHTNYDAFTKDVSWYCCLCKNYSHYHLLGDLFGPIFIEGLVLKKTHFPVITEGQIIEQSGSPRDGGPFNNMFRMRGIKRTPRHESSMPEHILDGKKGRGIGVNVSPAQTCDRLSSTQVNSASTTSSQTISELPHSSVPISSSSLSSSSSPLLLASSTSSSSSLPLPLPLQSSSSSSSLPPSSCVFTSITNSSPSTLTSSINGETETSTIGGCDSSNTTTTTITTTSTTSMASIHHPLGTECWLHESCLLWVSDITVVNSKMCGLEEALTAAQQSECSHCGESGATIGCLGKGCVLLVHVPCGRHLSWLLDELTFRSFCPKHNKQAVTS